MKQINLYINGITEPTDYNMLEHEPIDISQLDILNEIPPNSCQTILAGDVLDYIENEQILSLIISKLAYDGELIICGVDLYEVCRQFAAFEITISEIHAILYNKRVNINTFEGCLDILRAHGLSIVLATTINKT